MAMVNSLANVANVKDSRWLQLEVCREFQRNKCTRPDTECKFAHPPANVEVQNGRVIACYDSMKGRCNREKPPCKYFHPPQHLKDQLLLNGQYHLAMKNALKQVPFQPVITGQMPTVVSGAICSPLVQQLFHQQRAYLALQRVATHNKTTNPYITSLQTVTGSGFGHYLNPSPVIAPSLLPADALATPLNVVASPLVPAQKIARTDRLEVCREYQRGNCKRQETECRFAHPPEHVAVDGAEGMVTVCMDFVKGRCSRDQCRYFHPPPHLQAQLKAAQSRANATAMAYPGMLPYTKRPALDKSGVPVYQPNTSAYQQAFTMQVQQPFVPVTFSGHLANMPRF